jgi:elongation factor Ts
MADVKISAQLVKELRDKTAAGIMECKEALTETAGNIEKAIECLRKKGVHTAERKGARETSQGAVGSYIHMNGTVGTMVELRCETDFVARTAEFQKLLKELCMQVAAAAPLTVSREDLPEEVIEKEKEIYRAQIKGKPDHIVEKIIEGKLGKFYEEKCLLDQPYIRDDSKKVEDLLNELITKTKENIVIRRFCRFGLAD